MTDDPSALLVLESPEDPDGPGKLRAARQAIAAARGQDKLDLLLSAPDPVAFVQSLPPEELYFALIEIGRDDAAEVVALASPDQFKTFIDLSCWPRPDEGAVSPEVLHWLRLAREGGGNSDAAEERYKSKLASLDVELLSLVLRKELRVIDLEEEPDPEVSEEGQTYRTPEGRFLVEFAKDGAGYSALRQLLDDLVAQDPFIAHRMLESLRWEMPTELEETARRWRDGRLRDLGFPGYEEALAFYARPATTKALKPIATSSAAAPQPSTIVSTGAAASSSSEATKNLVTSSALVPIAAERPLLDRALSLLDGVEFDRAEEGIVYASNAALVVARVALEDATEVRLQLLQARATLTLGLEVLSGGDSQTAARVLAETPVRSIFQAAMGEAYRLQSRARAIAVTARLPQAQSATLLDPPLAEIVDTLAQQRPMLHEPGRRRPRALGSRADLDLAASLLDEAEATVALLEKLDLSPVKLGPLAEAAGLGPAALRASDAVRALAEARLRGEPVSLISVATSGDRPKSLLVAQQADELLTFATASLNTPAAQRAAERLKSILKA